MKTESNPTGTSPRPSSPTQNPPAKLSCRGGSVDVFLTGCGQLSGAILARRRLLHARPASPTQTARPVENGTLTVIMPNLSARTALKNSFYVFMSTRQQEPR